MKPYPFCSREMHSWSPWKRSKDYKTNRTKYRHCMDCGRTEYISYIPNHEYQAIKAATK